MNGLFRGRFGESLPVRLTAVCLALYLGATTVMMTIEIVLRALVRNPAIDGAEVLLPDGENLSKASRAGLEALRPGRLLPSASIPGRTTAGRGPHSRCSFPSCPWWKREGADMSQKSTVMIVDDEAGLGAYLAKLWRTEDLVTAIKGLVG